MRIIGALGNAAHLHFKGILLPDAPFSKLLMQETGNLPSLLPGHDIKNHSTRQYASADHILEGNPYPEQIHAA